MMKSISVMLHSLSHLTKLDLDFSNCHITDEEIIVLSDVIPVFSHLSSFSLALENGELTDFGVSYIVTSLGSLRFLSQLYLNMEWCDSITDQSAQKLADFMQTNIQLIDLKLNVSGTSITSEGARTLQIVQFTRRFDNFELYHE
eukprot:TRINITY_DN11471_c0_g1_i2.p1 TRINITY_DN11471_c0_g1~~TRINITY_DN11471_c0_g1_i2.p1  ORF type:complete len:144 (-),score=16.51 TRINITY_DN11471_c0_g1_i2:9-440(-)